MGQEETTRDQIKKLYAILMKLEQLAVISQDGFTTKVFDTEFNLPAEKVSSFKSDFETTKDLLIAGAGELKLI